MITRLAIIRGSTGNNQLYDRGTTPWTLIGTLGSQYGLPDILTFVNKAFIANGYADVPWYYDGTVLAHITSSSGAVPAGANHEALHQGFLWFWNTAQTSGSVGVHATLLTATGVLNADLLFTALAAGAAGNNITIAYVNAGANKPLVVSVVGNDISVQLQTDGSSVSTTIAQAIQIAMTASAAASALVQTALAPGSTGAGIPPAMGPTHLAGGVDPAATSLDGPSSLRSSDLNNPFSWPAANQIFVDKDDGDQGMGVGQFTIAESGISPTTSLILFKEFTAYQMTGVFGSTSPVFAIQKVKTDMGCVAPRTIRFAPGFGLIRLTHRGFALFDGVDDKVISIEISPLIFGNEFYAGIDWANVSFSTAVVVANPPIYLCFCPQQGQALTTCFAYDLVRKSWTVLSYPNAVATATSVTRPQTLPTVLMGDFDEGHVRSIFNPPAVASNDDDGAPIQWQADLRPAYAPSPQQRGYFRRTVIKVWAPTVEDQEIDCVVLVGPNNANMSRAKSKTLVIPTVAGATQDVGFGWGEDPWGETPWGDSVIATEADMTLDVGLIGTNARVMLSGEHRIHIRGIEHHVMPKPLVRASIYG